MFLLINGLTTAVKERDFDFVYKRIFILYIALAEIGESAEINIKFDYQDSHYDDTFNKDSEQDLYEEYFGD